MVNMNRPRMSLTVACAVPTSTRPVFGLGPQLGGSEGGSHADGVGVGLKYLAYISDSIAGIRR